MPGSKWNVVGITRNPESDRAKQLKELGVTLVKGDLDDQASIEGVMKDAHGCFLVPIVQLCL